jgi:hypothetical protein
LASANNATKVTRSSTENVLSLIFQITMPKVANYGPIMFALIALKDGILIQKKSVKKLVVYVTLGNKQEYAVLAIPDTLFLMEFALAILIDLFPLEIVFAKYGKIESV